tara:strand:+ start:794 stop:1906 length:1113 start_codon:yes stop_codon:yes gene_type:complete
MKKFIKKFIFLIKKFNFKDIKKVDILLLDDQTKLNFSQFKISRLYENINLNYVFRSILRFLLNNNSISDSFFIEYIYQSNPKICISSEISQQSFKSKKYFKNITAITHQIATYWPLYKDIVKKRYKGLKTDIFLLHTHDYRDYFNFLSKKFFVVGSLSNNQKPLIPQKKKNKFDIMFISEFRKKNNDYLGTNKNLSDISFAMACSSYLIKLLKNYCEEREKTMVIALASNRKEKHSISREDEIEFYKRDFPKVKFTKINSLSLASETELAICLTSNLGPELLSRKQKVLFLNVNHFFLDWELFKKRPKKGLHWYKGNNKKIIFKKLDSLLNMKKEIWEKKLKRFNNNLPYDYNNQKMFKIIQSILRKKYK